MPNYNREVLARVSLLLISVILALLQEYSFNKSFVIDIDSKLKFSAISDNRISGLSLASIKKENGNIVLDCEIIKSNYAWPFCEIAIELSSNKNPQSAGIDLSNFDSVKIFAQYVGLKNNSIRFQIRSFNPTYSTIEDDNTWKYNGLEVWPYKLDNPIEIPLNSLQVATWWLVEQNISIADSAPDLKKSMVIELATGNNIPAGSYQIILNKIEFHGKRFSTLSVYSIIILLWFIYAISGILSQLSYARKKHKHAEAKALELRKLNKLLNIETETLKDQITRDPLTGALNRSGIEPVFTTEIPIISLAFIDIDHFKKINDNYGHTVGDEVLVEFTSVISKNCRDTDFLARWGGEEFILVCPNTTIDQLFELTESLRNLLEEHEWPHGIQLTSSFGIAQKKNEDISSFIERADQALYSAKAQGRNRVISAQ